MKTCLVFIALSISQFAVANNLLDNRSYCRTVMSAGHFGQPKGERLHCLVFARGMVTDDANTFFGNPPETWPYQVHGDSVTFDSSEYTLSYNGTVLITAKGATVPGVEFRLQL